ncbi:hypothetical protein [Inquilinus sp. OTU3971]|uniref:hypothetical protein n=1 Tax=Inquilinus sp. OTU3971 TaxID=3043855 RepID=UPI00313E6909
MRLFGLAVLLTALSACAAQAPRPSTSQTGTPPFQAIAPAGYCLSDESDPLALAFMIGMSRNASPDRRILAIFRPCGEPAPTPGVTSWNTYRLIFQVEDGPPTAPGRQAMDRETYLTFLANPKLTELWNRRVLPGLLDHQPQGIEGARYLGSDAGAVYNGFVIIPRMPAPGVVAEARIVLGQTLIGRTVLKLHVVNMSANSTPKDWNDLQTIAAQAVHATIAAAERPARGQPASPPATPAQGAGLST